ncbi:MAG: hypothetical protein J6X18_07345 [Bacteroidales bacterium]|nr:hypothetical protein [Bacteroidales bacterium]
MKEEIQFRNNSPYGDYSNGEYGWLVGFVRGGDDIPCGVVRKKNGTYVMATLTSLKYVGDDD